MGKLCILLIIFPIKCCIVISAFVFSVLVIQGRKSLKTGRKAKKDRLPKQILANPTELDLEAEIRWKIIVDNHSETIPYAVLIFLKAVRNPDPLLALIIVISYIYFSGPNLPLAVQPWRTLSWLFSSLFIFIED